MTLDATSDMGPGSELLGGTVAEAAAERPEPVVPDNGVIWLGVAGAMLGLLAAGGVWSYALLRPWFQPWDKPLAALLVMTAPYPFALLVALAGRFNRTMAAIALAACAVIAAFIVRLGAIGLFHLPAAILLLVAAVLVLSQPLQVARSQLLAGILIAVGAVAMLLSGASTVFRVPALQECVAYWELPGGRTIWRHSDGERVLVAQETPEGFRDDVRKMGLICNLNSLTPRKAALGLSQIGSAGLALIAIPVSVAGLAFLAPVMLSLILAAAAAVFVPTAAIGLPLILAGAVLSVRNHRRGASVAGGSTIPDAGDTAAPEATNDTELQRWQGTH